MIKKEDIHKAYRVLREKNHDIPDETLEFIRDAALKALEGLDLELERCPTCFSHNTVFKCTRCGQQLCQDCDETHVCTL